MPKRQRTSGGYTRSSKKRSRLPRGRTGKRSFRRKGRRMEVGYSFSRWITSIGQMNVTNCTYDLGTSVITATAAQSTSSFSATFSLDDLPNRAEFSNLFDSYMITGVKFQIKLVDNPDSNSSTNGITQSMQNNWYPTIWYVADDDDHNAMTLAQIKEFQGVRHRVLKPNQELNVFIRPKTLTQLYRSSLTSGYATSKSRSWIDMAQPDVPYYALKFVVDFEGLTPVQSFRFKINARYFFKCKHVR